MHIPKQYTYGIVRLYTFSSGEMHKVTGYVQPDIKVKLKALAKLWRCSESQALTRLIAEKKVKTTE